MAFLAGRVADWLKRHRGDATGSATAGAVRGVSIERSHPTNADAFSFNGETK
ncbi:MAG: hypothetical protein ACXW2U_03655 [Telluria sp.]